jgi:hypothetical protein
MISLYPDLGAAMNILPCVFTCGSQFGGKLLFGLWTAEGISPVRVISQDKVRHLFGKKSEPVPDELDLLLIGWECLDALSRLDLLGPILISMAEEMQKAVMTRASKRAQGTDKRYLKQQAEFDLQARLMGLMPW